ncbi:TolC family protein [Desulfovibrio sp. OttesenSCG-928-G15]|nr:TolC family protein [Desulfovibrio sp. OttesenSCG-928-G15]
MLTFFRFALICLCAAALLLPGGFAAHAAAKQSGEKRPAANAKHSAAKRAAAKQPAPRQSAAKQSPQKHSAAPAPAKTETASSRQGRPSLAVREIRKKGTLSLSLEEAVTLALERNFSVKAAEAGLEGAASGTSARRSAFGPVLGTGYDYDRRQHGRSSSGSAQDKELFTWRTYLTQNVFSGFATLAEYQKAALKEESARENLRQARLELIRTVQTNFILYLQAKQDLKSAEDAVERLRSQLASSEAYYSAGISPRIDVLQAEVDVSTAESALLVVENALVTQRVRLNTLLLLPIDADTEFLGVLRHIPFSRSLDTCLKQAYVKRPDIIIAEKAVAIAGKDRTLAQQGFYPQVNAYGAWETTGNDASASGSPNRRTKFNEWSVGLSAEWPVFEWGKTVHESRQAGHEQSRVKAEADNLKQEIGFSVTERMLAMTEAAKRIRVAEKAVEQAREAYRMADARYRQQVGTMTDVLDAQAKLSASEASLAGARADYGISLANLYIAIGEENPGLSAGK